MTYEQALAYVHALTRFGSKPGLTRVAVLLDYLGNPQRGLRCLHVAGTNGKGSTSAMLDAVLREQGYRVGLCTSPYMLDFRERIRLDGEMVSRDELAQHMAAVKAACELLLADGHEQPTEFEVVVALTLRCFAAHKLDFCVMEVGLGGRWDATNVIEPPLVAAITSISYDHTEYLGDSLAQIAREKCGIFKRGSVAVAASPREAEVRDVIVAEAAAADVPLTLTQPSALSLLSSGPDGSTMAYRGLALQVPLAGAHQCDNAAVAVDCLLALRNMGFAVSDEAIVKGLAATQWQGRLQVVQRQPLVVLDVAHNPDGMRALCEALDALYAGRDIVAVLSMCSDKQAAQCVPMLASRVTALYTAAADTPRALSAGELAKMAAGHCTATTCGSVAEAVKRALEASHGDGLVLICGSHYMMAEAREALAN